MNRAEIIALATKGKMTRLRSRLRKIEKQVIDSSRPERRLRSEAVTILGVLDN